MSSSYTQADLDALRSAYASGVLQVEYAGKKTVFRSLAEMAQIIATVTADVSPSTVPSRVSVAEYNSR